MSEDRHLHDISDYHWALLEPHLPGRKGAWGRVARDNRRFINAVLWILRTGSPWRDLPPQYGGWKNVHRRFCRWRDRGVWEQLLQTFVNEPDFAWLMIDAARRKAHQHGTGAGSKGMALTKGGNTKRRWPI